METLSYQLSQIGFYFAVVKNSDNSQYNIVQTDDIINFDSSWIADNSKWPGPDNPNPKLKKTRWFPGSRWFEGSDLVCGYLLFIGTKDEAIIEKNRIENPESNQNQNQEIKNLSKLLAQMRIEFDEVKVALHQMKTENDALKLLHQEKNSIFKFVGSYKQMILYLDLREALNQGSDIEGFQYLVRSCFGVDFETKKKAVRENYEDFVEKPRLKELMFYFCHCKQIAEINPSLMYGQKFPDMPLEDSMEIKSFVEGPLNPTNVKFNSVFSRVQELGSSYGKLFTNYYHNVDKTED
ncbi:hypothetical protein RDWZM_004460 [Blomia tropicalis]|uniref:Uncharacterized protein n=1 Tax=Blomia tropicalis TaxID=40697 RepID=A0A9Q0MH63_BLOTA|nr:hypothetical protein RDWZM_004460 [Blomia tropicalis]